MPSLKIATLAAVKELKINFLAKKAVHQANKFLDIRMGIIGALGMGAIVYYINSDHGVLAATIPALKQALYTFFFGALFVKMAENLSVKFVDRFWAVITGGCTPAILTSSLTYVLHAIKGTPEPFYSTVPTVILSTISFSIWAYLKHKSINSQKAKK